MQSLSQRERQAKTQAIYDVLSEAFWTRPWNFYKMAEDVMGAIEQVELDYMEASYERSRANEEKAPF